MVKGQVSPKLIMLRPDLMLHWCPGCNELHPVHLNAPGEIGNKWDWDGNLEGFTVSPSLKQYNRQDQPVCHYFIQKGRLNFCSDCNHDFSGKSVVMPDIPETCPDETAMFVHLWRTEETN